MVFGILVFEVRVTLLALLCSEVLKVFWAFFCITKLVLKINTRTILTTIDGRGIITLARSETDPDSARPGTRAKFGPRSPVAILFLLISIFPHAVALIAPFSRSTFGPIKWGSLFCLTEVGVIGMATPQLFTWVKCSERSAHFITNPKVKTTLFIHRVVDSRKFWEFGPVMFKRVIEETVVGMDVSLQLLAAAPGPVVAMKRGLHQGSHDAPHSGLIAAPVALSVVLHSQHMASLMGYYKSR